MLGRKVRVFKPHTEVRLDDLVPDDNFYRQLEQVLDLSFVRKLVATYYSPLGRPSIDPVVFFKLQLIMFFEDIRSERQLMATVHLNLAHRWYIGYDLDEAVPDHSSLSKIRERYGLETFLRFFEHVVELCVEAGLVWGEELYFDGTKVRANASVVNMMPRFYHEARQHLSQLFKHDGPLPESGVVLGGESARSDRFAQRSPSLIEKYDGTRITSRSNHWYERVADYLVSGTDPDASPMARFSGDLAKLGYHDHYVVDGGQARIILAALVTPASIMDNTPMLDLARWVRFRWHLRPRIAVGDSKYGTAVNIAGLEQDGLKAFIPRSEAGNRHKFYAYQDFHYEAERDVYLCPQGEEIRYWYRRGTEEAFMYRADAATCNTCPVKSKCTNSQSGRHIMRSFYQEALDRAAQYRGTEGYARAMRKRRLWPEPLFGEAKQWHGLRQFRLRGLWKVNAEGLMVAAGQNLKRLLAHKGPEERRGPVGCLLHLAVFPLFTASSLQVHKSLSWEMDFFNRLKDCATLSSILSDSAKGHYLVDPFIKHEYNSPT